MSNGFSSYYKHVWRIGERLSDSYRVAEREHDGQIGYVYTKELDLYVYIPLEELGVVERLFAVAVDDTHVRTPDDGGKIQFKEDIAYLKLLEILVNKAITEE